MENFSKVSSIDDWKKNKIKNKILDDKGEIKRSVAAQETLGFDLCIAISEELSASINSNNAQNTEIASLWQELEQIMKSLPKDHAYFYFVAFQNFWQANEQAVAENFDAFLESKRRLFNALPDCDWWIDNFIWVFNPPYPGFYNTCAESFHKYFPNCSIGWVCNALEQSESVDENVDIELDLLWLAISQDENCFLAYYLIATLFSDLNYYSSALSYYKKASKSAIYSQDPSFFFEYARCAEKADENELVISLYASCLDLDEFYPGAINNLGCINLKIGKYDTALSYFNKAILAGVDGSLPYRNVVVALEKSQKFSQCLDFIKENQEKLGYHYTQALPLLAQRFDEKQNKDKTDLENNLIEASFDSSIKNLIEIPQREETFLAKRILEDEIESLILQNKMIFGRKLKIFKDEGGYGRQYFLKEGGRIDLLCENQIESELCIINVYNNMADERTVFALANQMDRVRRDIAQKRQFVTGIIFCKSATPELKTLIARLIASTQINANIEVYEYAFNISPIEISTAE